MWLIKKNGQNKITMFNAYFEYGHKKSQCAIKIDKNSDLKNSASQQIFLTIFTAFMQL